MVGENDVLGEVGESETKSLQDEERLHLHLQCVEMVKEIDTESHTEEVLKAQLVGQKSIVKALLKLTKFLEDISAYAEPVEIVRPPFQNFLDVFQSIFWFLEHQLKLCPGTETDIYQEF